MKLTNTIIGHLGELIEMIAVLNEVLKTDFDLAGASVRASLQTIEEQICDDRGGCIQGTIVLAITFDKCGEQLGFKGKTRIVYVHDPDCPVSVGLWTDFIRKAIDERQKKN